MAGYGFVLASILFIAYIFMHRNKNGHSSGKNVRHGGDDNMDTLTRVASQDKQKGTGGNGHSDEDQNLI
jgi:hypothetical protein